VMPLADYLGAAVKVPKFSAHVVYEDRQKRMWIGTDEGVIVYDGKNLRSFKHDSEDPASLTGNTINDIQQDAAGNIWIATNSGLAKYSTATNSFASYRSGGLGTATLSSDIVYSIAFDNETLWLGTEKGLNVFNPGNGQVWQYRQDNRDINSLSADAVRCVMIDRQGIYWLGTLRGGVDKYDKNLNVFDFVRSNPFDANGLRSSIVTSFAEDGQGKLFVGTESDGLSLFDPATRTLQSVPLASGVPGAGNKMSILALEKTSPNQLLIGSYGDGLFIMDTRTRSYRQLVAGTGPNHINSNEIFCIKKMHNGQTWVGTNGAGINVLNQKNQVILRYTPTPLAPIDRQLPVNGFIRAIEEDEDGQVWIATHGGGVAVLDTAAQKFKIYTTYTSTLSNDKVQSLLKDALGNMWVGTFGGGLDLFDKAKHQFITYSEKEGLANATIYHLLSDNNGRIWMSTNKGISSIDIRTKAITNYNYNNGVQNNNFYHGAGIRISNGQMFFGGLEGFNYFNPDQLRKNVNIPEVLITDLKIANQSVTPSADGPLKERITEAKRIDLDYKQNFSLGFVGLGYTAPGQNQYAYKLENFDKDWNYVGHQTNASYTNLDPGHYVFRVKASNNDGVWNDTGASLEIYVHPPFWRTTYAYIIYLLAFAGALLYYRHQSHLRLKRKFALERERFHNEQEQNEKERVHQLDTLKIKFLTNLSHEFRTPISLILGPVERLLTDPRNYEAFGHLQMIKRNGKRLLNLVNQLLDFRKMEEHELVLNATPGELVAFLQDTADSFADLSERKRIKFHFDSRLAELQTSFDHDKLERIVFNLLSNAFKFTEEGGMVKMELEKIEQPSGDDRQWVSLKISDTGIGIEHDKLEKIFDQFFQSNTTASILNQGSGIGLSITKEFVKMHGGTIRVASEEGTGSVFTIELPLPQEQQKSKSIQIATDKPSQVDALLAELAIPVSEKSAEGSADMASILLVEDNEDFRFYLKDNLRSHYKVFEAKDGKEGWQRALADHPDVIVSDISMPFMNGIEFCQKVKTDKRTSHIPVILLTAMSKEEDQLRGLSTGANDYITKPFNFEILQARINNFFTLNHQLKTAYTRQIKILNPEVVVESDDEKFLKNVMTYIDENLLNPQLSVEEMSRHMAMSRSSLYNKVLELTGETPVEFIRSVKLDKAAQLLEKSDMNVTQIAYSAGFSTANYFAKSFKVKFGMLPSEYRARKNKGKD
jgi:signal transduction histidine kinase/ligand-binding sensor domain-containing protein/DNA-binding response OmpR family regulator